MLYLGLTKYVCFNHRLKCFLFFTYFKKRYKVTKLWLKITICSHPKCTKLEFSQKWHHNATQIVVQWKNTGGGLKQKT